MTSRPRTDDDIARIRYNAIDPTSTTTLRSSFQGEYGSRWRDVRGRNRDWLSDLSKPYASGVQGRYRDFFISMAQQKVLDPLSVAAVERGDHWTGSYIRQAYQKGLDLAGRDLAQFDVPKSVIRQATDYTLGAHQERVTHEFTSVYYTTEEHVTFARQQVSQALRLAIQQGKSKTWLVEEANARLRSKVQNRYKATANTAVVRAVNEALVTTYAQAGVSKVGVATESSASTTTNTVGEVRVNAAGELEFQTAGDDKVCSTCQALAGQRVKISEIRDQPHLFPPVHPNCRCRLVPVEMEVGGETVAVPESYSGGLRGSES